jgi:MATE family multidrug resistance protein
VRIPGPEPSTPDVSASPGALVPRSANEAAAPGRSLRWELSELVRLSVPIAVAQLALMAMGLVDVAVLGHASKLALGGAGIGRNLGFAAGTLSMGVAYGLEPLAAQALGAGDSAAAYRALRGTLRALLLLWGPAVLIALGSTFLLGPLGVEPPQIPVARSFVVGQVGSMLGFPMFLAGKSLLQAHGRTGAVLWAAAIGNVVNALLVSVLVHGDGALAWAGLPPLGIPPLGALGAGISMSVSSFVLAGVVLFAARDLAGGASFGAESVRKVLSVGAPIGLAFLSEVGVFVLVSVLAGRFGAAVTSAHQIALSLASFTFMGALGVSGATSVRVGRAVGEGRPPRRAGVLGIGTGAAVMSVGVLAFTLIPRPLASLFSADEDVVALGVSLLRIASLFQLFDGVQCVAAGALRGMGDVRFSSVAMIVGYWFVAFPIAMVLGFALELGVVGLWYGLTTGLVVVAGLLSWRFWSQSGGLVTRL